MRTQAGNRQRWDRGQARWLSAATLLGVILVACLSIFSVHAASAKAAGEFEPNDSRETAYGPLAGGTPYTATFETDNDVDWYVFYVKTYSQMDFSATMVKSCPIFNSANILLYDKDGKLVDHLSAGAPNVTTHLLLTMNPGRYYLEVTIYECTGNRYRFQIDPASSITTNRECGEAIVAKESVAPVLAKANKELAKNEEALVTKTEQVHEAKQAVRKSKREVRRLSKRRRASRWKKRQAIQRMRRSIAKLNGAKADRAPVWRTQTSLQAIVTQHQQEITAAEGQIAASC